MLDEKGFDLWADGYDRMTGVSDEENSYPFAGYKNVLGYIYRTIMEKPGASVLDLGFGTAALTSKLYEQGCRIYGQDFSKRMIEIAKEKMPDAQLYHGDFSQSLVQPLMERKYDFIVSTYAMHHLSDEQKVSLIKVLYGLLEEDGRILIGDVAFPTRAGLDQCRLETGDEWDDEEVYFAADEMQKIFPGFTFTQISMCAGILELKRKGDQ